MLPGMLRRCAPNDDDNRLSQDAMDVSSRACLPAAADSGFKPGQKAPEFTIEFLEPSRCA